MMVNMITCVLCDIQDTVVALQALAAFAKLTVVSSGDDVGLQLTAAYGDESHQFTAITRRNALLLQTVQVIITHSGNL